MSKLEKNPLEWIVFAVGLVLVVGVLGYLVYDAATRGDRPPIVVVATGTPEERGAGFVVPVRVTNRGDRTAEAVRVEVTLERAGQESERGEFETAFLPRGATRDGDVVFKTDPRTAQNITARVLGYEKP